MGEVAAWIGKAARKISLSSRSLRVHFEVAVVLISIIPMLVLAYVLLFDPPMVNRAIVLGLCILLIALGYWLIGKYPRTLLKLHDYLRRVANGEVPRIACLMEAEKDIVATERYLNLILDVMRDKIHMIERQKRQIAEMERKKAITESLSTACHYLGQPATVIVAYLDLMGKETISASVREMVNQCQIAGESITRILSTLNQATACQSEPYLRGNETERDTVEERILKIDGLSDYEVDQPRQGALSTSVASLALPVQPSYGKRSCFMSAGSLSTMDLQLGAHTGTIPIQSPGV